MIYIVHNIIYITFNKEQIREMKAGDPITCSVVDPPSNKHGKDNAFRRVTNEICHEINDILIQ